MAKVKVSRAQRELYKEVEQLFVDHNKYRLETDEFKRKLQDMVFAYAGLYPRGEAAQKAWADGMSEELDRAFAEWEADQASPALSPTHGRSLLKRFDPETLTGGMQA